jgi:hypothetical protein
LFFEEMLRASDDNESQIMIMLRASDDNGFLGHNRIGGY